MPPPEIGTIPPAFTLPSASGREISLADYAGKPVLLWFFSRAYGKGCTLEARSFRDHAPDFADKDTIVLGITTSAAEDLASWGAEVGLMTDLLSDEDRKVCTAYGALESGTQARPKRISVLIGRDGKVARVYTVDDAPGHATQVLNDIP